LEFRSYAIAQSEIHNVVNGTRWSLYRRVLWGSDGFIFICIILMRGLALYLCGLSLFLCGLSLSVRAGSVITLAEGKEINGKLTLNSAVLQVEGATQSVIDLSDVLEADFSDIPFHLDYFSSQRDPATSSTLLPEGWKAQDIGAATVPGSASRAAGVFTLLGAQWDPSNPNDLTDNHYFFTGTPWTGDGQWTIRVGSMSAARAGLMLRETMDPSSAMISTGASNADSATMSAHYRTQSTWSNSVPTPDLPVWLRMSRRGPSVDFELSKDGKEWTLMGMSTPKFTDSLWAGFFINSHREKTVQNAIFDHVTFTPASGPTPSRIVPTGVLLRSGSFLAGYFDPLNLSDPKPVGRFLRNGRDCSISAANLAAVICHPMLRSELSAVGSQGGVILKNNDFMAGDVQTIDGNGVALSSVQFGLLQYSVEEICACTLHPVQPQAANYEIRLRDGSDIRAKGVTETNGQIQIDEISGVSIAVAPEEIAQFSAGESRVQSVLDLAWKVPTEETAGTTQSQTFAVQCWTGNEQQQIMVVPSGMPVDFPLTQKFKALATRIALSPGSPPNSQAIIRVLADGKEIARTSSLQTGDQPRFIEVTLDQPKVLTLIADSASADTRVLFINPLIIR
jgi:hypothetical protein